MLGHKLYQIFSRIFDTFTTTRGGLRSYSHHDFLNPEHTMTGVSVEDFDSFVKAFSVIKPNVVVNCIGIVKQSSEAKESLISIKVNALFPHCLAQLCKAADSRLIHMSTDCVFSGSKGNYVETDKTDAEDLYGRTKALGEVNYDKCLTLRTSIIGPELETSHGLLEWFIGQEGKTIRGFRGAIFSGFTTYTLGEIIANIIRNQTDLQGIWHVASKPINKFDLLTIVKQVYGLNIEIEPDDSFKCDRSLNDDRFRQTTGFEPPAWKDMILKMNKDTENYSKSRGAYAHK